MSVPKGMSAEEWKKLCRHKTVPVRIGSIPTPVTFRTPRGTNRRYPSTKYGSGIARKICERIAMGETLSKICEDDRYPSKRTVVRWLMQPARVDFREAYYYARRVAAEVLMDEVIENRGQQQGRLENPVQPRRVGERHQGR